jgi:hypothetical protein
MSTYPLAELLRRWSKGDLTSEQMIGHLLQNQMAIVTQQSDHEKRLRQLEQTAPKPPV